MTLLARLAGIAASIGAIGLWIVLDNFNPYGVQGFTQEALFTSQVMMLLSVAGMVAAWRANPYLMLLVSLVSFFPIGLYLLGTPGIFRWIGVFNILLLLASLPILSVRIAALAERRSRARK